MQNPISIESPELSPGCKAYTMQQARRRLQAMIRLARSGTEVVILRHGHPMARLVAVDAGSATEVPRLRRKRVAVWSKLTAAKLMLAEAALQSGQRSAKDVSRELGITPQTLFKFLSPAGERRRDAERLLDEQQPETSGPRAEDPYIWQAADGRTCAAFTAVVARHRLQRMLKLARQGCDVMIVRYGRPVVRVVAVRAEDAAVATSVGEIGTGGHDLQATADRRRSHKSRGAGDKRHRSDPTPRERWRDR